MVKALVRCHQFFFSIDLVIEPLIRVVFHGELAYEFTISIGVLLLVLVRLIIVLRHIGIVIGETITATTALEWFSGLRVYLFVDTLMVNMMVVVMVVVFTGINHIYMVIPGSQGGGDV